MDNCLTKLARASIVRHGGWRDLAGAEGCKDYEMYQESVKPMEVFETNSFCTFLSLYRSLLACSNSNSA